MINQTVETAFRVLLYLGAQDPNRLVSLQEIHDVVGGSATYLAKVTAVLSRSGLISSQRGAAGGLQIGREPKKIGMLEVVESVHGGSYRPFALQRCTTGKGKWCNYHAVSDRLNALVINAMGKINLAEMMVTANRPAVGCVLQGVKPNKDPRIAKKATKKLKKRSK